MAFGITDPGIDRRGALAQQLANLQRRRQSGAFQGSNSAGLVGGGMQNPVGFSHMRQFMPNFAPRPFTQFITPSHIAQAVLAHLGALTGHAPAAPPGPPSGPPGGNPGNPGQGLSMNDFVPITHYPQPVNTITPVGNDAHLASIGSFIHQLMLQQAAPQMANGQIPVGSPLAS